jgi:hypothetical protein
VGSGKDTFATRAVLVGAWVLATLLAGSVTWAAVANFRAGGGSASSHVLSQTDVRHQLVRDAASVQPTVPTRTVPTTGDSGGGRRSGHASTGPPHSAPSEGPATSARPSHATQTTKSVEPPPANQPSGDDVSSPPPPTHHSGPPPQSQSRSWSFDGGRVGASCSGSAITLVYSYPDDGWSQAVVSDGPDRIELRFHEEDEHLTTFTAQCVGGAPVGQVSSHEGEGEDLSPGPSGDERGHRSGASE